MAQTGKERAGFRTFRITGCQKRLCVVVGFTRCDVFLSADTDRAVLRRQRFPVVVIPGCHPSTDNVVRGMNIPDTLPSAVTHPGGVS